MLCAQFVTGSLLISVVGLETRSRCLGVGLRPALRDREILQSETEYGRGEVTPLISDLEVLTTTLLLILPAKLVKLYEDGPCLNY